MKYTTMLIILILSSNVRAQYIKNTHINYEGSLEMSSATSFNDAPFSMFGIETIHGILFEDQTGFVGIGAGVNIVHYTPYVYDISGDVTPDMFQYDFCKSICPTVSLNTNYRMNHFRKLRKKLIPFFNFKFMYLWNFRKNTGNIGFNLSESTTIVYPVSDIDGKWIEFGVGTELILRNSPNLYVECGWIVTSGTSGEAYLSWSLSSNEGSQVEAEKEFSGEYKVKAPATFYIKIGMHLWGKK